MDIAVNEAPRALNSANLRRYTDLQCPKARRPWLMTVQRLVQVLLGDANIVCGTNTKGEVCLSGVSWRAQPSLAHLVAILHSQLRSMRPRACYAWHAACIFPSGPFCKCPAVVPNGT